MFGPLLCGKCSQLKSVTEFYRHGQTWTGYQSWCTDCTTVARRARLGQQPLVRTSDEEQRYKVWVRGLSGTFGMVPEVYEQMMVAQGRVCAICKRPPKTKRLAVDHDHACCPGEQSCGSCVRGLLCITCNLSVGYVETHLTEVRAWLNL